ncbi:hypothetical protein OsJ_30272 [Oryza sativa Japonica Group]|uniref:Uncharacterized protein n=1 Tax=Oryza sativa subsp. japonica TaxID=39947 RepID=A3C1B6_ORYSJ|nr:hypothetical protein OsJ_30272 [Oryza sativa Japonica Group]
MSDLAAERRYKEEHRKLMAYGMADGWAYGMADGWARDLMDKATEARWRVDLGSSVWVILLCVAACLALGVGFPLVDFLVLPSSENAGRIMLLVWALIGALIMAYYAWSHYRKRAAAQDVLAKAQDVFNQAGVSWPLPVYCFKKPSTNLYPDNMGPITIRLTVPSVDTYNTSTVTSYVATDNTSTITSSTIVHPHTLPL